MEFSKLLEFAKGFWNFHMKNLFCLKKPWLRHWTKLIANEFLDRKSWKPWRHNYGTLARLQTAVMFPKFLHKKTAFKFSIILRKKDLKNNKRNNFEYSKLVCYFCSFVIFDVLVSVYRPFFQCKRKTSERHFLFVKVFNISTVYKSKQKLTLNSTVKDDTKMADVNFSFFNHLVLFGLWDLFDSWSYFFNVFADFRWRKRHWKENRMWASQQHSNKLHTLLQIPYGCYVEKRLL